jgi:ribosomal protein L40E
MFCCKCGAQNPDDASYCHKCGVLLFRLDAQRVEASAPAKIVQNLDESLTEEQRQLIDEVLSVDPKPSECHICGRTDHVYNFDFGLGKKISTKREWSETALSVAVSALTLPLLGAGGIVFPGKKNRFRILKLRLVLCDSCERGKIRYEYHPWWTPAKRLGYSVFFSLNDLKKLEPAK